MVALAATFAFVTPAQAATVPFTETFATDAANWAIDAGGTEASWNATGGPSGGTFISRAGTPGDGPFSGPVIFRGQDGFDSSGDAFVGDWITAGVGVFTVDFFHDHSIALNVSVRFANPLNDPGASSVNFLVDPGSWTTLTVPIVDSTSSFQSYGSGGAVPNPTAFNTIFSNIGNIQLSLASGQVGTGLPGSVTLGIANPSIAAVPEPGTWAMAGAGAIVALGAWMRRKRGGHAA
jgi:hypothetical protein